MNDTSQTLELEATRLADVISKRPRGWIDYNLKDAASGRIDAKSSYFELVGDIILGCGIYKARGVSAKIKTASGGRKAGRLPASRQQLIAAGKIAAR